MKQLLLTIPKMMDEVLKKVEEEDLNASPERKKETKKLLRNLRNITTEMRKIAEDHDQVSQHSLFKILGDIQNIQEMMPEVSEEHIEKLKEMSPEFGSLMGLKNSLFKMPKINEVMNILSPTEKVKEQSLKEGIQVEKSTKPQPQTDRVNSAKNED